LRAAIILCLLVLLTLLTGCGDVKQQRFTKDNHAEIMEKARKSPELSVEDAGLLVGAMTRMARQGRSLEGKTVGELIEEQRSFVRKTGSKEREKEKEAVTERVPTTGHVGGTNENLLKEYPAIKHSTSPVVSPRSVTTYR
jgi:hypothetical protein